MDLDSMADQLGTDVDKVGSSALTPSLIVLESLVQWQRVMVDMKKSRRTFDNSATQRRFGPIVIEYGQVQTKVLLCLLLSGVLMSDGWHR